ncbi:jg27479 [Pararge aegeria aegeria]|uniref:Jg27479 protein n=1 Tax=Pararge aegeria aegeria TaxID=348720 RepID=A0A8S4QTY5_9NEOP|nr:jg27479 [Pararge aegeria aegeria]
MGRQRIAVACNFGASARSPKVRNGVYGGGRWRYACLRLLPPVLLLRRGRASAACSLSLFEASFKAIMASQKEATVDQRC